MALKRRLYRLEKRLNAVVSTGDSRDRDVTAAYVAIEALNAWNLFARSFYLSCALGATTERRAHVTITVPPAFDHLGMAITRYKKSARPTASGLWHRRDEPPWHDPNVVMTLCSELGCSIQTQIVAAFSLQQTVFSDLPVVRNFFAHRNEGTSQAARNVAPRYTLPMSLPPSELLLAVSPGTNTSVLLTWLDEMNVTAEFMCKA